MTTRLVINVHFTLPTEVCQEIMMKEILSLSLGAFTAIQKEKQKLKDAKCEIDAVLTLLLKIVHPRYFDVDKTNSRIFFCYINKLAWEITTSEKGLYFEISDEWGSEFDFPPIIYDSRRGASHLSAESTALIYQGLFQVKTEIKRALPGLDHQFDTLERVFASEKLFSS